MANFSYPGIDREYLFARAGPAEGFADDDQSATYCQTGPSPPARPPPPTPRGPLTFGHRGAAQERPMAHQFLRSRAGGVHPLRMNPPMIPASSSMPLNQLTQSTGTRPPFANTPAAMDPEEINRKIQQMIDATEKLKGKAPPPRSGPSIPASSTTSKLFSKPKGLLKRASSVLNERFLSRSNTKETFPKRESVSGLTNVLEERESPIAPIEMRLNEGTNLSNPKVQKMVGAGRIKRKPVAGGGKSLRQQMSTAEEVYEDRSSEEFITHEEMRPKTPGYQGRADDPFSVSPSFQRRPTNFEDRLRARSGGSTMLEPFHSEDPFSTEGVLASDYTAPLNLTPGGASTPRPTGVRAPRETIESPTRASRRNGMYISVHSSIGSFGDVFPNN